jgi:hypothetical protein
VPLIPPGKFPRALFDSLGTVMTTGPGVPPGPYRRDIVMVSFKSDTPQPARQAAIDSIGGEVVGGSLDIVGHDGTYYVRISGGTFDALVHAVGTLQRQPQVIFAAWWPLFTPDVQSVSVRKVRTPVPLIPPGRFPRALFDSLGTVMTTNPGVAPGPYRRDIVIVKFNPGTPQPARQAAIDSIGGEVVGGSLDVDGQDGAYYVRISGGTFDALVDAVATLHRQPQVGLAGWWPLFTPDVHS